MTARNDGARAISRRAILGGMLATGAAAASPAMAAPSLLTGRGRFRSVRLRNAHTDEWIRTVYWVEDEYIPEALDAIDHLLRDWRKDAVKPIDPATIDILSRVHEMLDCEEPFHVISGYRTAQTNAMLRRSGSGVARRSLHSEGRAADLRLAGRTSAELRDAARRLRVGGVGHYPRSGFIHVDTGRVRYW